MRSLLGAGREPAHVAVLPRGEEAGQPVARLRAKLCTTEADGIEAELQRAIADHARCVRRNDRVACQVPNPRLCRPSSPPDCLVAIAITPFPMTTGASAAATTRIKSDNGVVQVCGAVLHSGADWQTFSPAIDQWIFYRNIFRFCLPTPPVSRHRLSATGYPAREILRNQRLPCPWTGLREALPGR